MKSLAPIIGLALGLFLLACGLLWPYIFSGDSGWTEEKSTRMSELVNESHELLVQVKLSKKRRTMHGGPNPAEVQQQFDEVQSELATLREECDAARDQPLLLSRLLKWVGGTLTAIGIVCCLAIRGG